LPVSGERSCKSALKVELCAQARPLAGSHLIFLRTWRTLPALMRLITFPSQLGAEISEGVVRRRWRPGSWLLVWSLLAASASVRAQGPQIGTPVALGSIEAKKLKEVSGAVAGRRNPGVLWVHNDGAQARLFALSTNGQVLATFKLQASVTDAEDIAVGPGPVPGVPSLYLGDIGDNKAERRSVRVYRFPEPRLERGQAADEVRLITDLELFGLTYPDRPHDAEALWVDPLTGDLWLATKQKQRSRLYRAAAGELRPGATIRLAFVAETPFAEVSGGDVSANGAWLILRREDAAAMWHRAGDEDWAAAFARPPCAVPVVGPPREPNGESIAFAPDGTGYYTLSEGKREPIFFFPIRREHP
jgi:hypothetical protein